MRRLGELPFVVALRDGLPWSFIGLAVAFVGILASADRLRNGAERNARPARRRRLAAGVRRYGGGARGNFADPLGARDRVRACSRCCSAASPRLRSRCRGRSGRVAIEYLRLTGTAGLFIAMLACGIAAAWIWLLRRRLRPSLADWLGSALGVATFAALYALHVSLPAEIAGAMQPIAHLGDTYLALIAIVVIETLLWTAGVHGPAVLAAIVTPVYLTMQMQNTHAFTVHQPLPYVVVVSLFLFVFPGGAGATLPLAGLFAFSRVPRLRRVGRATIVPALFNLNEPLLFAAPVVFNPHLVLPFVGAPVVLATVTYIAVATGLVSRAAFYVPSSIPTFVSTYLATQDLRAIALAAFNIALATAMYYPFVRAYERHVEGEK